MKGQILDSYCMHFLHSLPNHAPFLRPVPPQWGFWHPRSVENRWALPEGLDKGTIFRDAMKRMYVFSCENLHRQIAKLQTLKMRLLKKFKGLLCHCSFISSSFPFHPLPLLGAKSVVSLLKHRISNIYVATYSTYLTTARDAADKPLHQVKVRSLIHYHSKLFRLFLLNHAVAVFCTSSWPLLAAVTTLVVLPVICNLSNMIEPCSFV